MTGESDNDQHEFDGGNEHGSSGADDRSAERPNGGGDNGEGKRKPPQGFVPLSEVQKERQARQNLERRLQAIENERNKPAPKAAERDDPPNKFEDPKAYSEWVKREAARNSEAAVEKRLTPVEMRLQNTILRTSESSLKSRIGDAKYKAFDTWLREQPDHMKAQLRGSDDPYGEAYGLYRQHGTFSKLGSLDLDEWFEAESKRRAGTVENEGGGGEGGELEAEEVRPTPKPLASARSAGGGGTQKPPGPKPLGEILASRRKRKSAS